MSSSPPTNTSSVLVFGLVAGVAITFFIRMRRIYWTQDDSLPPVDPKNESSAAEHDQDNNEEDSDDVIAELLPHGLEVGDDLSLVAQDFLERHFEKLRRATVEEHITILRDHSEAVEGREMTAAEFAERAASSEEVGVLGRRAPHHQQDFPSPNFGFHGRWRVLDRENFAALLARLGAPQFVALYIGFIRAKVGEYFVGDFAEDGYSLVLDHYPGAWMVYSSMMEIARPPRRGPIGEGISSATPLRIISFNSPAGRATGFIRWRSIEVLGSAKSTTSDPQNPSSTTTLPLPSLLQICVLSAPWLSKNTGYMQLFSTVGDNLMLIAITVFDITGRKSKNPIAMVLCERSEEEERREEPRSSENREERWHRWRSSEQQRQHRFLQHHGPSSGSL